MKQQEKMRDGSYGKKLKKRKKKLPRKLFPVLFSRVSTSGGLTFPLTGPPSCFGQSIMSFQTLRLEDLAALTLVNFLKINRQKSCKINSSQCTNILETSSYERVEMLCSRGQ